MFWKNVNIFKSNSLSLVTKLMLFYSLSTIGLLAAIFTFLYPTFIRLSEKMQGLEASNVTAECYGKIILTLLVSSLISIVFGYFVARQGLQRMREFENKIEQITADSLHERIDLKEWPKELKSFGKKFNMMLDRLQASFNQLSQFSSDIAHELRTPINNLRGMTEIALADKNHPDSNQILLEKYMQEYEHLSKLIENLLFLARSDHGQLGLKKEKINARDEILKICDYYQALALENSIELSCAGNANISVDSILFKRMMSNLLSNAFKYTETNGKIKINIVPHHNSTNISITDTGLGIPSEHLDKIFDRFYRVDSSRSQGSGGLGLGLAIVKSIIDLHNGKLSIESQLRVGTTVVLEFPSLCTT